MFNCGYRPQDIQNVREQRSQMENQRKLQEREYALAEGVFKRYEELADRKVISPAEFQQQQAALLGGKGILLYFNNGAI